MHKMTNKEYDVVSADVSCGIASVCQACLTGTPGMGSPAAGLAGGGGGGAPVGHSLLRNVSMDYNICQTAYSTSTFAEFQCLIHYHYLLPHHLENLYQQQSNIPAIPLMVESARAGEHAKDPCQAVQPFWWSHVGCRLAHALCVCAKAVNHSCANCQFQKSYRVKAHKTDDRNQEGKQNRRQGVALANARLQIEHFVPHCIPSNQRKHGPPQNLHQDYNHWGWNVDVPKNVFCVCGGGGGDTILKRKACMGPGVGAQRRGPVPKRMSDGTHHDCTGPP